MTPAFAGVDYYTCIAGRYAGVENFRLRLFGRGRYAGKDYYDCFAGRFAGVLANVG